MTFRQLNIESPREVQNQYLDVDYENNNRPKFQPLDDDLAKKQSFKLDLSKTLSS